MLVARLKLDPLLKEGLYDESRNLLNDLGYHTEETEEFIADLGENAVKSLNLLPKIEKNSPVEQEHGKFGYTTPSGKSSFTSIMQYSPEMKEKIENNLHQVLSSDPSTNLILLRKAYENKGVDWEGFKDALNNLILKGSVKLNADQLNFLDKLEEPPLNKLDKILFHFGQIGR